MATWLGTTYFDNYANYELSYDLLSQNIQGNYSVVRLYGTLHVTGYKISWDWGNATVHTETAGIGTYYSRGDYVVIQRDFTFYHDNNGNFSSWIGGGISTSYHSGDTGGTMTLPKINRYPILNSGSNFTDEGNPVFNITAYGTFPIRVKLEAGGNTQLIIRDLSTKNSTNYTLELTNEERETLRNLIPNSNSLKVRETVCAMNGNAELSASYRDYTMSIVNANPIFSDFDFADINPVTVALTGSITNDVINVKGYSNIEAMITPNNIAEARKSATMSKYRFKIGDSTKDITYSSQDVVSGVINNASNGVYELYAIDSRNNSTLVTKLATREIAYEPIYLDKQNSKIERDDNRVGDGAILTLNGNIWNNNFGEVTNSITLVTYRLKKTDSSTWITGTTTITPTITDNSFTFTGLIASDNQDTSWDLNASYNVEVTIEDELSSTTAEFILNSAIPTMSLDKNGVGIMCAYDSSIGGSLQVNGTIIDGGKLLWENPNPNNKFNTQDVILNSDDYNYLEIYYYDWVTPTRRGMKSVKVLKGYNINLDTIFQSTTENMMYMASRRITYTDATHLSVGPVKGANSQQLIVESINEVCVPIKILGYK